MNTTPPGKPDDDAMLCELASLGMRAARVVTRLIEIEQAVAELAAGLLPAPGATPASLDEALAGGQGMDAALAVLAQAGPRVEGLGRALDRASRSVRRCVALRARLQAGWPRAGRDDRATMVRRQVARGVGEVIRDEVTRDEVIGGETDGEAERLFDELAERLDAPGLDDELGAVPIEEAVRRICVDLGLVAEALVPDEDCGPGIKRAAVLLRGSGQRHNPHGPHRSREAGEEVPAGRAIDTC